TGKRGGAMYLTLTLNGRNQTAGDVPGHLSLLDLLRQRFGLLGAKEGCGIGECGACTVLLNGAPVNSCLTPAWKAHGKEVTTIEGLAVGEALHPIQEAFIEAGAIQCGFCTPGMIMATAGLLRRTPNPTAAEIKTALAGNLCRCTGYQDILEAVRIAAAKMKGAL
ncbi:MAG: (2Fe-2S)-binding protein, partial [Thermodesulfobacteriota bacterium]